jgi:succinyl-CoA synthetase beta subunit
VRPGWNNVEAGRKILHAAESSLTTLQAADDLADAGEKVVKAVG